MTRDGERAADHLADWLDTWEPADVNPGELLAILFTQVAQLASEGMDRADFLRLAEGAWQAVQEDQTDPEEERPLPIDGLLAKDLWQN